MDLRSARKMALELIKEHSLMGWKFTFDRSRRRFGCCNHSRKKISISSALTLLNDETDVRDTIAHEIAHALTPGRGHSQQWKRKAKELGALPERCFDKNIAVPEPPFLGICPVCGKNVKRYRRSNVACAACCKKYNGGRYSEKYRIVFKRISV